MQIHIHYQLGVKTKQTTLPINGTQHLIDGLQIQTIQQNRPFGQQWQINFRADQDLVFKELSISIPLSIHQQDKLFCNGFQSWTLTDEFPTSHQFKKVALVANTLISPFGDYHLHPYTNKKGHLHGWTYSYIRPHTYQPISFFGSVDERSGYTLFKFEARGQNSKIIISKDCKDLHLAKGNNFAGFNIYIGNGTENDVFDTYFDLIKEHVSTVTSKHTFPDSGRVNPNGAAGFTSWYNYYTHINETIISENLHAFAKHQVPLDFFQIDDGWQPAVGDWMQANQKFPNGLKPITQSIKLQSYQAGLWLAPFICQHQSELYKQHPDFLLRKPNGKPVTAAYNFLWRSFMYALNFYNPRVQDYLKRVFDTILNQWDFDLVKLDFLYAVALQPPPGKTRGQVMYEAMEWLRQTVGDKLILGCGVPLGAAFGQTDYCRIGPDIHLSWDMVLLKWLGSREGVSTLSAIKNAIHRRQLNGRAFANDPDVSILRNTNHSLNPEQKFTLFFVNQLFGSLQFVSDNIDEYPPDTLHLYLSQFPLKQKNVHLAVQQKDVYQIHFSIGNLHYLAYCNLTGNKTTVNLSADTAQLPSTMQSYFYSNQTKVHLFAHETIELKPYQTACLLAIDISLPYSLAGGDAHLFPCSDIENIEKNETGIAIETKAMNRNFIIWLFNKEANVCLENAELLLCKPVKEGYLTAYRFE